MIDIVGEERVRRPDLEIAAAAAGVLDVGLDDVCAIDDAPVDDEGAMGIYHSDDEDGALDPEQSRRLSALFDLQDYGRLTEAERTELDALVVAWGRAVNERGIRDLAARRGVPVEQMQAEVLGDIDRTLAWWREAQDDPARLEAVVREVRARQRARLAARSRPTVS